MKTELLLVIAAVFLIAQTSRAQPRPEDDGIPAERLAEMEQTAIRLYPSEKGLNPVEIRNSNVIAGTIQTVGACAALLLNMPDNVRQGSAWFGQPVSRRSVGLLVFEKVGYVKVPVEITGCKIRCEHVETEVVDERIRCTGTPEAAATGPAKYVHKWELMR